MSMHMDKQGLAQLSMIVILGKGEIPESGNIETAKWLRALAVPSEDLDLVTSTHI